MEEEEEEEEEEREGRSVVVSPRLTVEPLATHYFRRADGYRFLRRGLGRFFRRTDAPLLFTELAAIEGLFRGAGATACTEIGLARPAAFHVRPGDRDRFRTWRSHLADDPDVTADRRMMVPVSYDPDTGRHRVWAILGWTNEELSVSFDRTPRASFELPATSAAKARPRIEWRSQRVSCPVPVMREAWVTKLLTREQFRAACDQHQSIEEILTALGSPPNTAARAL